MSCTLACARQPLPSNSWQYSSPVRAIEQYSSPVRAKSNTKSNTLRRSERASERASRASPAVRASEFICVGKVWFICMLRLGEGEGALRRVASRDRDGSKTAVQCRAADRTTPGTLPAQDGVASRSSCLQVPLGPASMQAAGECVSMCRLVALPAPPAPVPASAAAPAPAPSPASAPAASSATW